MDTVFIEGLTLATRIGIYAGERDAPQPVTLDLRLGFDNAAAGASGRIEDALDYAAVVAALRTFVAARDCGLLEQLAEACCDMLRARFHGIHSLDLRIDKPHAARALGCTHVGVAIHREFP